MSVFYWFKVQVRLSIAIMINHPQTKWLRTTTTFALVFTVPGVTGLSQAILFLGLLGGYGQSIASSYTYLLSPQLMSEDLCPEHLHVAFPCVFPASSWDGTWIPGASTPRNTCRSHITFYDLTLEVIVSLWLQSQTFPDSRDVNAISFTKNSIKVILKEHDHGRLCCSHIGKYHQGILSRIQRSIILR